MSEKNLGRAHWNVGIPVSPDVREKLSMALTGANNPNFGVPKSEETKEKLRVANVGRKGKPHTEEFKQHIDAIHRGVSKSIVSNEKRSVSLQGKPKSDEAREKMRRAKQGSSWSPARRAAYEARRQREENVKIPE